MSDVNAWSKEKKFWEHELNTGFSDDVTWNVIKQKRFHDLIWARVLHDSSTKNEASKCVWKRTFTLSLNLLTQLSRNIEIHTFTVCQAWNGNTYRVASVLVSRTPYICCLLLSILSFSSYSSPVMPVKFEEPATVVWCFYDVRCSYAYAYAYSWDRPLFLIRDGVKIDSG